MRKLAEGKSKIYEQLIEEGIITREQLVEVVTKDNELMAQTVPFNGKSRLKPNIHDPHEIYRWQDEEANAPAWVWAMRVLGTVGFVVGIYALCLLTFLF